MANPNQPKRDEKDDLYKDREQRGQAVKGQAVDQTRNVSRFLSDVTAALSDGMRVFGQEIDERNVTRVGVQNGFIRAGALSTSRVLEKVSVAIKESYERMAVDKEAPAPQPVIDYDLLAKKVVEKMKEGKGTE